MELIKKYFRRRALKKHLAALENFRHTDEDILDSAALAEIDAVLADGKALKSSADKDQCKAWAENSEEMIKKYCPHCETELEGIG